MLSGLKLMVRTGFMEQATFRLIMPTFSSFKTESRPSVDSQAQVPLKWDIFLDFFGCNLVIREFVLCVRPNNLKIGLQRE